MYVCGLGNLRDLSEKVLYYCKVLSVPLSQPLGVGSPLGQEELKTVPGALETSPVQASSLQPPWV